MDKENWKADRVWLKRLESDPDELFAALEVWQWDAVGLNERVGSNENAELLGNFESKIEIPSYFEGLTDLLVSFCDVFHTNLDATPLWRFKFGVLKHSQPSIFEDPPKFSRICDCLHHCFDIVRRLELAGSYRHKSAAPIVVEDAFGEDAFGEEGVHGLRLNRKDRMVKRKGFDSTVDLSSAPTRWAVLEVMFDAGKEQADLEVMRDKYKGEWNDNARNQAYSDLRKRLEKPLMITIKNRRLEPLSS